MKKIIAIVGLSLSLISCQEKLPTNIQNALSWYEMQLDYANQDDSLILSLNQQSIEKLSTDSINHILDMSSYHEKQELKAHGELRDLLKYNSEYSDHTEIKNANSRLMYKDYDLFRKNKKYMQDLVDYRMDSGYYSKPVYKN